MGGETIGLLIVWKHVSAPDWLGRQIAAIILAQLILQQFAVAVVMHCKLAGHPDVCIVVATAR